MKTTNIKKRKATILVVEDDSVNRSILADLLTAEGYRMVAAESCAEALAQCPGARPDAAILDYLLPDGNALELLPKLRDIDSELPAVLLTSHGSIELAVEAMRGGAFDFLTKPVDFDALARILARCLTERQARRRRRAYDVNRSRHAPDPFRGTSAAIRELERMARKVAENHGPAMILGGTGSGKGVLARWLHTNGPRAAEPFVEINCAGLKPDFLESELFGYKKGAFTGASEAKPGLLEVADRGTLFLDELGDMDLGIQAKLLKVLEEQIFRRLGGVRDRRIDVRLITATHDDLGAQVQSKKFRADLYFRLHTLRLEVPSLASRREDIPSLAEHLLTGLGRKLKRPDLEISSAAIDALMRYSWPGNIRELSNILERAILLNEGSRLDVEDLQFDASFAAVLQAPQTSPAEPLTALPQAGSPSSIEDPLATAQATALSAPVAWEILRAELRRQIEAAEMAPAGPLPLGDWLAEDLVQAAHDAVDGVASRGAALLGMSESTYRRWLSREKKASTPRGQGWDLMHSPLETLLSVSHPPGTHLFEDVRHALLQEVLARSDRGDATAAALLAVTPRTLRRWRQKSGPSSQTD